VQKKTSISIILKYFFNCFGQVILKIKIYYFNIFEKRDITKFCDLSVNNSTTNIYCKVIE